MLDDTPFVIRDVLCVFLLNLTLLCAYCRHYLYFVRSVIIGQKKSTPKIPKFNAAETQKTFPRNYLGLMLLAIVFVVAFSSYFYMENGSKPAKLTIARLKVQYLT